MHAKKHLVFPSGNKQAGRLFILYKDKIKSHRILAVFISSQSKIACTVVWKSGNRNLLFT